MNFTDLKLVTLSTLTKMVSPAEMLVVHPVRVLLVFLVAVVTLGFAEAVMVFDTVGG